MSADIYNYMLAPPLWGREERGESRPERG
jgi:hypothetical protein